MRVAHVHDKNFKFRCDICDYGYPEEKDLELHKDLHQSSSFPFKCVLCDLNFTYSSNLKKHVKFTHTDFRPLLCDSCPKVFCSVKSLNDHQNIHRPDKDNLPTCTICQRMFSNKRSLDEHMTTHDTSLKYICYVCGKSYKNKRALQYHLKAHENKLEYACRLCEKRFNSAKRLKFHENIHSGQRPFKCECGKDFISKKNLKQHEKHCGTKKTNTVVNKQNAIGTGSQINSAKTKAGELIQVDTRSHVEQYNDFQQPCSSYVFHQQSLPQQTWPSASSVIQSQPFYF